MCTNIYYPITDKFLMKFPEWIDVGMYVYKSL